MMSGCVYIHMRHVHTHLYTYIYIYIYTFVCCRLRLPPSEMTRSNYEADVAAEIFGMSRNDTESAHASNLAALSS